MHEHDTAAPPMTTESPAPPAAPRPRRRRRRWLIGLVCLLVLVAIPVAGYFALVWKQQRELDELIAELERTDPNWRLDDLMKNRPVVPDEQNPALVMRKVDALLQPGNYDVGQANWPLFETATPPVNRLNAMQVAAIRASFAKRG